MKRQGTHSEDIVAALRSALPDLRRRYGVTELRVFGSWVRGDETADSDVDVLVAFDRPVGFFRVIELEDELTRLLSLRVDLVVKDALRPTIARAVLAEAVPV